MIILGGKEKREPEPVFLFFAFLDRPFFFALNTSVVGVYLFFPFFFERKKKKNKGQLLSPLLPSSPHHISFF